VGRSRAANTSARQAKGKYVLIHDDDDSLEIDFLAQTTAFLQNHPNYVGVVTHTMCVAERIDEDTGNIVTLKTSPENFFVKNILISHMLQQNLFSPIAFLCDRNVFVNAGGYCEDVDTLEDYYLNLKILAEHGDIGLIQKHLANHHIRHEKHKNDSFDNTTVELQSHHKSEVIIKNKLLREDFQNNKNGLGLLWAIADMTKGSREVQRLFANIENRVNNSRILRFLRSKLLAG
jgi:glycosyltransferase involved in cell wall biosynthesis